MLPYYSVAATEEQVRAGGRCALLAFDAVDFGATALPERFYEAIEGIGVSAS